MRLRLLTRAGCHLCEEMRAVIEPVAAEFGAPIDVVDIDTDPALRAEFTDQIPVLFVNDRKAFKYRLTAAALRARLRREGRPRRFVDLLKLGR